MSTVFRTNQAGSASWGKDIFWLSLLIGTLFFILLGSRPLFVPDEGRYAEIAREMLVKGDYITPFLNNIRYFEKPALFYWLGAAAFKLGGVNLWSIRSVNGLLGLLSCLLMYLTGRRLYDRRTGLLAAGILATSLLYFVMVHMVSLDLPVTVFLSASLCSFILAVQSSYGGKRRAFMWCAFAAAALAVLTKGLIGIVFPVLIVGSWIALTNQWKLLLKLYLPSSIGIFFLLVAPWHILVEIKNPGFFHFYFIEQHFLRYATPDIGHYQPAWFFLPILFLGFFPWTIFLPQTFSKISFRKSTPDLFFLLWFAIVFIFFSFSNSKLIPYILPLFPPLALLTARYLALALPKANFTFHYFLLFLLSLGMAYLSLHFTSQADLPNPAQAKFYLSLTAVLLSLGTGCCLCLSLGQKHQAAFITLLMTAGLFFVVLTAAAPSVETRTIAPLAKQLKPMLGPKDEVITYNHYYQDLPFYLERRVNILNWRNELSYGMTFQDTHSWMLNDEQFWQKWNSQRRVFVFINQEKLDVLRTLKPDMVFYRLGATTQTLLITNRP